MGTLIEDQRQMYLKVLQLHEDVQDLKAYAAAMRVETAGPSGNVPRLEYKSQTQRWEVYSENEPVPRNQVEFPKLTTRGDRSEGSCDSKHVWIEWKEYDKRDGDLITDRVKQIVALLKMPNKPKSFRCPNCVGYFEEGTDMFGFLYEKPNGTQLTPTSLLDLFSREKLRPSLGQRILLAYNLATTVLYLHAVDWMHKSLRSDNVLFFFADGEEIPCDSPTISGYDFARPSGGTTEHVYSDPNHDVYRHPKVNTREYEVSFDIYSLGIVLVEVAYWQPIRKIMKTFSSNEVKKRILDANTMRELKARVGDGYADAVRDCLQGLPDNQRNEGIELQKWFQAKVVLNLDRVGFQV
ncbi:hypothetical protein BJY01DRAFT_253288 [Aspergillus pseudoustus]|uniref:Protein kinase domain-containing protein n=1 Tax=Aspergillus pseudoustus TaxID=1810923 RepID=A0ABR4J2C9_9EURO